MVLIQTVTPVLNQTDIFTRQAAGRIGSNQDRNENSYRKSRSLSDFRHECRCIHVFAVDHAADARDGVWVLNLHVGGVRTLNKQSRYAIDTREHESQP